MSDPSQTEPPVLIYDPNRSFRMWNSNEIYTGTGPGRYVPNPDDAVLDWTSGFGRVVSVDYTTGLSAIEPWTPPRQVDVSNVDVLLGAGPGTVSESYRIFLDTSVMPHTFAVDKRLHMYGTDVSYMKIFLGANVGSNGQVISAFYDQGGNFLGENIPMELVSMPSATVDNQPVSVTNYAVKAPMVGYTLRELPDGELVTSVFYSQSGQPVSVAPLVVKNSAYIRTTDASKKYIQSVDLESPFISSTNPRLIQYPINMPVGSLNLMGVVTYSDGSKMRLPVDGTKFSVYGLDNYIASIQGQRLPVVLTYRLSANEFNYMTNPSGPSHVSQEYEATTMEADGAYSVKLFVYPVWVDELHGYRLEAFLCNLDRQRVYNVTNYLQVAQGSRAYDPVTYGSIQHVTFAIDMNRVDPVYARYRHAQTFDITLLAHGDEQLVDNWTIGFDPGQNPPYGRVMEAKARMVNQNLWQLRIDNLEPTLDGWLEKTYYATRPLFDPETEARAPQPNYFAVTFGSFRQEFPISQWNQILQITNMPNEGQPIFIHWIKRNNNDDLQLGVSGMIVHKYQSIDGSPDE